MKTVILYESKKFVLILALVMAIAFGYGAGNVFADTGPAGAAYTPLIEITSVPDPLVLPEGGGSVTFIYKVTNPGAISLSNVTVSDDQCGTMSGELGDTNGNHFLDPNETWIYTCKTIFTKTTTDTATVTAYTDGLRSVDSATIAVVVAATGTPGFPNEGARTGIPGLPNNGTNPGTPNAVIMIWGILGGILVVLIVVFFLTRKRK